MDDEEHIVGDIDRGTRKRKIKYVTSKERKREIRYSDYDPDLLDFKSTCAHGAKKLKCRELLLPDIKIIKENFYSGEKNKDSQDNKLAQMLDVKEPERQRKRGSGKAHDFHIEYNVWYKSRKVSVCQKLFMSIFNCGQRRLHTIAKKKMEGKGIKDNRGGDRKSQKNTLKMDNVKKFISSLKGHESHYGRNKSRRMYLSSEYNIKKLWMLCNGQVEDESLKTNYRYFSRIFSNKFNIAFGSPATDVCGFCTRTNTEMTHTNDVQQKTKLKTELTIHKVRVKQFFKLMKEELTDSVSYCFDLQQVQVLPKSPIGDAFYAQQLAFYAFCVTDIAMKSPVFYTWLEHEAGRGVVEISSALTDFLKKTDFDPGIKHLRLFSDGCGGQNKNSHIVHALMLWLFNNASKTIETITMTFPVRGHSFMPADRVFGQIEIALRANATMKTPEKYYKVYRKKREVRRLGSDWMVYGIKDALNHLKKIPGIREAKRIIICRVPQTSGEQKILYKTEALYRNDDPSKRFSSLLKAKKKFSSISLPQIPIQHSIKKKKLDSLSGFLVKLSGPEWAKIDPELAWLDPIIKQQYQSNENGGDNIQCEEDEQCCCLVEDAVNVI